MMDILHIGQSRMIIDVSTDKKSLKLCEHDGHSISIVLTMMCSFPVTDYRITSKDDLYLNFTKNLKTSQEV